MATTRRRSSLNVASLACGARGTRARHWLVHCTSVACAAIAWHVHGWPAAAASGNGRKIARKCQGNGRETAGKCRGNVGEMSGKWRVHGAHLQQRGDIILAKEDSGARQAAVEQRIDLLLRGAQVGGEGCWDGCVVLLLHTQLHSLLAARAAGSNRSRPHLRARYVLLRQVLPVHAQPQLCRPALGSALGPLQAAPAARAHTSLRVLLKLAVHPILQRPCTQAQHAASTACSALSQGPPAHLHHALHLKAPAVHAPPQLHARLGALVVEHGVHGATGPASPALRSRSKPRARRVLRGQRSWRRRTARSGLCTGTQHTRRCVTARARTPVHARTSVRVSMSPVRAHRGAVTRLLLPAPAGRPCAARRLGHTSNPNWQQRPAAAVPQQCSAL